jgi:hypothetical protein
VEHDLVAPRPRLAAGGRRTPARGPISQSLDAASPKGETNRVPPLATDAASWAVVASAGAAAVAALASWAAVNQTARQWRRSQRPELQVDVVVDAVSRRMTVQAYNRGGGIAMRTVLFLIEKDMIHIATPHDHGAIRPAQMGQARSDILQQESSKSVVAAALCNDALGRTHAWTATGKHKVWSRRKLRRRKLTNLDVLQELIPSIDVNSLTPTANANWTVHG